MNGPRFVASGGQISEGQSDNGADVSLSTKVSHSLECSVFTCYHRQLAPQQLFQDRFKATTVTLNDGTPTRQGRHKQNIFKKKKVSPLKFDVK